MRRGVDAGTQAEIFAWPNAVALSARHRALFARVDELITGRTMSDEGWRLLAGHLDRRQLIEFVTLVGQYDALAMTLTALCIPTDYPDRIDRRTLRAACSTPVRPASSRRRTPRWIRRPW